MTFQEKFGNFLAKLRWISHTRSQSFSTSHLCRTIGTLLLGLHAIWTLFQGSSLLLWQSSFQFFQWRPWYRYVCASLFVQNKCASYPVDLNKPRCWHDIVETCHPETSCRLTAPMLKSTKPSALEKRWHHIGQHMGHIWTLGKKWRHWLLHLNAMGFVALRKITLSRVYECSTC